MSDRLALANAIEDAGIPRDKAVRVASVIVDVIHDSVATKADLAGVRSELRSDVAAVRSEIRDAVHQLTVRGLAALVSCLGALFAALHYWPPHE